MVQRVEILSGLSYQDPIMDGKKLDGVEQIILELRLVMVMPGSQVY